MESSWFLFFVLNGLQVFCSAVRCIILRICSLLVYMGRHKFHDLNCTSPEKKNHTKIVNQMLFFTGGFSWRDSTSFPGLFKYLSGKTGEESWTGSWYQSHPLLPANSFRSRTRSSKSSVAMSMVLIKARQVVMYGTTSAFFNSLMIKLNLYLCPLVSCVLKSEKNIEVSTNAHLRCN